MQTLVAGLIVSLALYFTIRHLVRLFSGKGDVGGCGCGCSGGCSNNMSGCSTIATRMPDTNQKNH